MRHKDQHVPYHLNSNIMCAISIDTTGPDPDKHDIVGIGLIPMDIDFKPMAQLLPFDYIIKPERLENITQDGLVKVGMSQRDVTQARVSGCDTLEVIDYFERWFEDILCMKQKKYITPLAYNWPVVIQFLISWMGKYHCSHYFSYRYRDILSLGCSINDMNYLRDQHILFEKYHFSYMGIKLGIAAQTARRRSSLDDALLIMEIYRRIISRRFPCDL